MRVEFRSNGDDTYDLWLDGRIGEYDLAEVEFDTALRRRRVPPSAVVVVLDPDGRETGYQRRR